MPKHVTYSLSTQDPILIVEPLTETRVRMARALQRSRLRTLAVSGGKDAVDLVRGLSIPALAIVELSLPDMSGIELATKLQKIKRFPIIFTASQAEPQAIADLLDLVAEDFVAKPIDERELVARVQRILVRRAKNETFASDWGGRPIRFSESSMRKSLWNRSD